jgi:RNA polymerase sigma-70 factor (ECF subfamily)
VISWTPTLARGLADGDRAAWVADFGQSGAPAVEAAVAAALETGRAAWPALALDPETFVRHLGRCVATVPAGAGVDLAAAVAECRADDLYLACAAGTGVAAAVEIVSGQYLEGVAGAVRKVHDGPGFVDDVLQILRHKLFVAADGATPKILTFSGRAPLGVWLAAVAQRTALSLRRTDGAQADLKARVAAEAALIAQEPELRYVQARYAGRFEEAFRHALGRLSERGRALLRLHVFMGMTLAQLANVYGVNDATISRWLARAREELLDETGKYMRDTFGVAADEFPSLARVLTSQLEVSIARLLGDPGGAKSGGG